MKNVVMRYPNPSPAPVACERARRAEIAVAVADPTIRARVCRALAGLGRLVAFGDGYHLLQHLADAIQDPAEPRPALVVVDAILPGCSGTSLLAGIRALGWETPVLLIARIDHEHLRTECWRRGATGVFIHPIEPLELSSFAELVMTSGSAPRRARTHVS